MDCEIMHWKCIRSMVLQWSLTATWVLTAMSQFQTKGWMKMTPRNSYMSWWSMTQCISWPSRYELWMGISNFFKIIYCSIVNGSRTTADADGRIPIAKGHPSYPGDPQIINNLKCLSQLSFISVNQYPGTFTDRSYLEFAICFLLVFSEHQKFRFNSAGWWCVHIRHRTKLFIVHDHREMDASKRSDVTGQAVQPAAGSDW